MTKSCMAWMLAAVMLLMAGCKGVGTEQCDSKQEETKTEGKVVVMPPYNFSEQIQYGNHNIEYRLERVAEDSVLVTDPETEERYADNHYVLTIVKDGDAFFNRKFSKADFRPYLDGGFRKYGLLDGFRFSEVKDGNLLFGVCISYPDSDMSAPFVVTVYKDGKFGIKVDDILDVDEDADGV